MSKGSVWVYAIRNVETGERLIGGAADVNRAWRHHQQRLRAGIHTNLALQEAWEIQGAETFIVEQLEEVDARAALTARIRAWVQEERQTYNTDWSPRLRPRTIEYRQGDEVVRFMVNPPTTIHRIETAHEMATLEEIEEMTVGVRNTVAPASSYALDGLDALKLPNIVAVTTYHLPFSECDLPLIKTEAGLEYVPVDAWCSVLGVRLQTHLWRLRHKYLWTAARELAVTLPDDGTDAESKETREAKEAMIALFGTLTPSFAPDDRIPPAPPLPSEPAATIAPSLSSSLSSGWPACWCLPRSYFLHIAWSVGLKWIDPALRPAIRTMQDDERAAEERSREERGERIAAYSVVRQRLMDALMAYERVLAMIRRVDEQVAPTRGAVGGATLAVLCDQGRHLIHQCARTARAALGALHSGGITEFTAYDPAVDAMRTQIMPNNPTLPDQSLMADLDAHDAALSAWLTTFHQHLHSHPPNSDAGPFTEDF